MFGQLRCPVDEETAAWVAEFAAWMRDTFGADALFGAELVLPTGAYLRRDGKTGHELALHVFEQVKALAGMPDWPCTLLAQELDAPAQVSEFVTLRDAPAGPSGSFAYEPGTEAVTISYNPNLVDDPGAMVATFAHELAHYLFATAAKAPPGGPELEEFATDLGAVFLGFGIFAVNSSFRFAAHGDTFAQGWVFQRQGYLSGNELSFALALFVRLTGADEAAALSHLGNRYKGPFRAGLKWLDRQPDIVDSLRAETDAAPA